jgi:osmotically-inducible protein OsmY
VNKLQEAIADGLETANVERAAQWRLEASAYAALKSVKCRFRRGKLLLSGHVPTYHHKQLAQEAIRALPGVSAIVNEISVGRYTAPNHVATSAQQLADGAKTRELAQFASMSGRKRK